MSSNFLPYKLFTQWCNTIIMRMYTFATVLSYNCIGFYLLFWNVVVIRISSTHQNELAWMHNMFGSKEVKKKKKEGISCRSKSCPSGEALLFGVLLARSFFLLLLFLYIFLFSKRFQQKKMLLLLSGTFARGKRT